MNIRRQLQSWHKIAFLGPEASFTHLAALEHFGDESMMIPQTNVAEVFQAVLNEQCHYGIVPVENSIEGAVNHTLDLFYSSELKTCAEHYLQISHSLLTSAELPLADIQIVFSHAQALAQCRQWLKENLPGALHQVLTPMADYGVNMVKLESRPVRNERWSYFFIVDFEGHREDDKVAEMIKATSKICLYMKVLGSYPQAV